MPEGDRVWNLPRDLRDPAMVVAFAGWNDAGNSATGVVAHLEEQWDTRLVAELDPDDYYDFQVSRPHVALESRGVRHLEWPTLRMLLVTGEDLPRDVVLVNGPEPNFRWRAFCAELASLATDLGITRIVMLGALLADVPHTRPVPVTVSGTDDEPTRALGLEWSRYEGPTGIVGVFQDAATRAGLTVTTLWAAVPHYVAQSPCPKATLVLLRKVEDLLDIPVELGDLPDEAQAWQHGVEELTADDPEIAEYVQRLEQARDTTELPEASGEHIAREFERYLRRRGD